MRTIKLFISFLGILLSGLLPIEAAGTKDEFVVVIDAGHGGHDPGAIGKKAREKNINLSVALAVGKLIEENCADTRVVYTRKTDIFLPLERRARIANNAKADLFISIHTNALPKGKIARGAETYTLGMARANENLEVAKRENSVILVEENYEEHYAGFNPNSSESYIMFEFMQDKYMEQSVKLAKLIQTQFRTTAKRIDKGVHQAGFLVLRATSMPSVLIELGYISTPDEEKYLNSSNGVANMSRSIYNAFVSYKDQQRKKTTPQPTAKTEKQAPETPTDTAAKQPTVKQTKKEEAPKEGDKRPVFKVQIFASSQLLPNGSSKLKGVKATYYKENGMFKYTYGNTTDYNEILRMRKQISDKFKGAFIVAFRGEKKIDVQEAIHEFKQNSNK